MYRIKSFSQGNEYQALVRSFQSALRLAKKNRKGADSIIVIDESGNNVVTYLKGLGMSVSLSA
jgi:hypothetical protein